MAEDTRQNCQHRWLTSISDSDTDLCEGFTIAYNGVLDKYRTTPPWYTWQQSTLNFTTRGSSLAVLKQFLESGVDLIFFQASLAFRPLYVAARAAGTSGPWRAGQSRVKTHARTVPGIISIVTKDTNSQRISSRLRIVVTKAS